MDKETEQFLNDLEGNNGLDVFESPLEENEGEVKTSDGDNSEENQSTEPKYKNRRERRLAEALEKERLAGIQMAAKLEAVTEAQKFRAESEPAEYAKAIERIYGTDSPEGREATELLKKALEDVKAVAVKEATEQLREEQRKEREEVQKQEKVLDSMIEEIEDEFNIDLTSTASESQRKGFFKMLEKLSPKDDKGNITHYADPIAVWETYQAQRTRPADNRAKELSSRSMTQSGASKESKLSDDSATRFLRENGII